MLNGNEMRAMRETAELRQIEVAKVLYLCNQTIHNWERDNYLIPPIYEDAFRALMGNETKIKEIKTEGRKEEKENRRMAAKKSRRERQEKQQRVVVDPEYRNGGSEE